MRRLSILGVYESMLKNPKSFRQVSCYSSNPLDAELVSLMFEFKFSEDGSNRLCSESLLYHTEVILATRGGESGDRGHV